MLTANSDGATFSRPDAVATQAFGAVAFLVDSNGVIVERVGFAEAPDAIARRIAAAAGG